MSNRLALLPERRRRRWRWLLVLGVVIAVRVALPEVLRRVLVSQASQMLHAQVEIGDVDLSLLRGGIALDDVTLRAAEPPNAPAAPPLVAWKRFAVEVRWLPLFSKTVRLREVELDSPRVALDRLEDGELNVLALIPARSETPPAEPGEAPAPAPAAWSVGVDRFVLRDGGVRFRDLTIKESEPIEVVLESVDVTDVAIRPGFYGEPSHLQLALALDESMLRLDARATVREGGVGLQAELEARNLPLHRTRLYVPQVGWSALQGALDATLTYQLQTGTQNELRGTVALRDVAVRVPQLDEPALAWRRLTVKLDPVDLAAHRVAVSEVDLEAASLLVRPRGGDILPLLAGAARREPAANAAARPSPAAAPWHWSVSSLRVAESRVRLIGADTPLDVGVQLGARDLADAGDRSAHVELALVVEKGSVHLDGAVRVAPPAFAGTARVADLSLPELVAVAGVLPPRLLQAGRLGSDLTIEAGLAAPGGGALDPSDLRVHGRLSLAEFQLAAADPTAFSVGARSLDVPITELRVPGVLPGASGDAALRTRRVTLGDLRLVGPTVQITRTPAGIALPSFSMARTDTAAPQPAQPDAPPPRIEVSIESVRIADGRVAVVDRTVTPVFAGQLAPLAVDVRALRWPELALKNLRVTATSLKQGRIDIFGALNPGSGWFEVDGERIALRPFNPYAVSFSGYRIARGHASVSTKASFAKGRYDANSWLTLDNFDLQGEAGASLFKEHFGIPLSMALALLRDGQGKIVLGIPVEGDAAGVRVGLLRIIGGALKRAVINALTSPLKLVGALVGGDKVESLAPAPLAFRAGRSAFAPESVEAVAQLGRLLASRPGIGIRLDAVVTTGDVRWLREQALREDWAGQGVLDTLRGLPQRATRERVRAALEARAKDVPGALSPEDAEALDRWLAERPPLAPARLQALANERVVRTATALRDTHGIDATRIAAGEPPASTTEGTPVVQIELESVGR